MSSKCPSCREAIPASIRDNLWVNILLQETILKVLPSVAEESKQIWQAAKVLAINEKKTELEELDEQAVDATNDVVLDSIRQAVTKAKATVAGLELLILEDKVTEQEGVDCVYTVQTFKLEDP